MAICMKWGFSSTPIRGFYNCSMCRTEISNKYSKRWPYSHHTYNLWYLYAFILIWILYSYSKFEVLIILNKTHDVVDVESLWIDIYMKHKIIMIRIRTLQYSVGGCVCVCVCCLCLFLSSFFVDEWSKSLA